MVYNLHVLHTSGLRIQSNTPYIGEHNPVNLQFYRSRCSCFPWWTLQLRTHRESAKASLGWVLSIPILIGVWKAFQMLISIRIYIILWGSGLKHIKQLKWMLGVSTLPLMQICKGCRADNAYRFIQIIARSNIPQNTLMNYGFKEQIHVITIQGSFFDLLWTFLCLHFKTLNLNWKKPDVH